MLEGGVSVAIQRLFIIVFARRSKVLITLFICALQVLLVKIIVRRPWKNIP